LKSKYHLKGQALLLTLVFAAATGLVSLLLFNSGILANAKTRLQNAADAAVYSASVLQARDQNFSAYTNRAMIANQAAVAQIVSLKSFIEDATDTGDRMGGFYLDWNYNLWPAVAPQWSAAQSYASSVVSNLNSNFGGYMAPTMTRTLDLLIRTYETAQQLHHGATLIDMLAVAQEVAQLNDPNAQLANGALTAGNTGIQLTSWSGSMKQHNANDTSAEADRFADVVVHEKTTDGFTRNRASQANGAWWLSTVKPSTCPGAFLTGTLYGMPHAGGTQLRSDKKAWLAMDATQGGGFAFCVWYCGITVCGFNVPIADISTTHGNGGSGGGLAGNGDYESENNYKGYKNNPETTRMYGQALAMVPPGLVRYSNGPGTSLDSSNGGLQDKYRDMAQPTNTPNNQSSGVNGGGFPITMEFERPPNTIRTSSQFLNNGANIIRLDEQMAGNNLRAAASAHSYFYRSATNTGFTSASWTRSDGKREIQNLFSPYWQSRLVDRTEAQRTAAITAQIN
jgi:hypothetical protein